MRRLVSVLETTTQGMDYRIARLAARLDPDRTGARWLPDLAAMLGLPFHDALTEADAAPAGQGGARHPGAARHARSGLLAMLDALFPSRPIRVVDRTEQLIPISLGRDGVGGRALPAMLAGPSSADSAAQRAAGAEQDRPLPGDCLRRRAGRARAGGPGLDPRARPRAMRYRRRGRAR